MIIEINIFLCEQLISMIIMGCPGSKIDMAAVSAKRSISTLLSLFVWVAIGANATFGFLLLKIGDMVTF